MIDFIKDFVRTWVLISYCSVHEEPGFDSFVVFNSIILILSGLSHVGFLPFLHATCIGECNSSKQFLHAKLKNKIEIVGLSLLLPHTVISSMFS